MCTYYVRDLSGNILSIYTGNETTALQKEMAVYGSGRLGTAAVDGQGEFIESYLYELTDHLSNVRATLKDNYNGNGILNSYADYYPGGMPMPGAERTKVASSAYKFGYQGQFAEKDPETGMNQFEARLYDARIMRWNVPDPAGQFWSPYMGMGNDWINGVDPDGRINGKIRAKKWANDNNGRFWKKNDKWYAGYQVSIYDGVMLQGQCFAGFSNSGTGRYLSTLSHNIGKNTSYLNVANNWIDMAEHPIDALANGADALMTSASSIFILETYTNILNYVKASPEEKAVADAFAFDEILEGAATGAPLAAIIPTLNGVGFNVRLYPNAKGVGMNVTKNGQRVVGLDWHQFRIGEKKTGTMVNRPHIDAPFYSMHHWPW